MLLILNNLLCSMIFSIDDTTYALAKRGFFGRSLLIATNKKHDLEISGARDMDMRRSALFSHTDAATDRRLSFSGLIASNNRVNSIVRIIYLFNAAILLCGLAILSAMQYNGRYRCRTINVAFGEQIWEEAHVMFDDGSIEERLLIYSYFNGLYKGE